MVKSMKSPRRLAAVAVFAIVAVSAFGFAASNSMPSDTRAGDGTTSISGYTVSNVSYNLDSSTPAEIDSVEFTLSAAATNVRASINGTNSTSCSNTVNDWICNMPDGVGVTAASSLYIVATQ